MLPRFSRISTTFFLMMLPLVASATSFPDVKSDYPHKKAVETLSDRGIIGGNPDGTFRPFDPIDRAAMLKLLYKAANLTPDVSKKKCFADVMAGSWYESYVCDAASRGFVKGYENNMFKPGRPVSRAEALKLVITVLGMPSADASVSITIYTDVAASDWYAPFVKTALADDMLPIAGQNGPLLLPNVPLERGEAAAYIWNALSWKEKGTVAISSSSATAAVSTASSSVASSRKSVKETASTDTILTKNFPFTDTPTIADKKPLSYRFTLSSAILAQINVGAAEGKVHCQLYRMETDGFSSEYYLGLEDGNSCYLQAALGAGDYQLQVQPTVPNVRLSVETLAGKGDGNDGFAEAKLLLIGKPRIEFLDANDLGDWYTFKVTENTSVTDVPGKQLSVKLVSASKIGCVIYSLSDVDLYGFSGPNCNESYLYPLGTYMVNVRHGLPRAEKETYTVELGK